MGFSAIKLHKTPLSSDEFGGIFQPWPHGHDGPIKGHGSKESLLGDSSSSDAKKAMERDLKAAELRRVGADNSLMPLMPFVDSLNIYQWYSMVINVIGDGEGERVIDNGINMDSYGWIWIHNGLDM